MMNVINPQFINDLNGQRVMVILPVKEFDWIMDELDELDDIRLYDEAKKDDTGEYVLFSDYLKNRKRNG